MATCLEVITHAHRMTNWRALNGAPTQPEIDFALIALQGLFDKWASAGMFGRLTDTYVTTDYSALEGERILASGAPTITIPTTYAEWGGEGSDRAPYDLALIEVLNGATRNLWLYDRNGWVDIAALEEGDECPLSHRGVHGLAACLATEIDGPKGFIPETVIASAAAFMRSLSFKGGSTRPEPEAVYF